MSVTQELQTSATVKPEVVFIEDLLDEVQSGQLRIPKFQRPFVWTPEDMRQLLDSIVKGYPIGSLLIWETAEQVASLDSIGPFAIAASQVKPISFVLDGHQRLTTLLAGLRLPASAPRTREQKDWKWWLFFDLEKKEFVHDPSGGGEVRLFPLRAALKTVDFLAQSRNIQCALPPAQAEAYIRDAEQVAQKIKAYKIPVTRIRGGGLSDAVAIFSRLNSLGMGMTADQMISALTYREGEAAVNLAEEIDGILCDLDAYNFSELPRKQILQVVLMASGLDLRIGEWEGVAKALKDNISDAITRARRAAHDAARFLYERAGVPDSAYLPYTNQFVVLSAFFLKCPAPTPMQEQTLLRWFWSTALGGWFAGANPSQLRKGIEEMMEFAEGASQGFKVMPLDMKAAALPVEFNSRNARIRCMLTYLFSRRPLDSRTMEPLPADEVQGENRGLSYVFTGIERKLLSHPANRILLHRKPEMSIRDQILSVTAPDRDRFLESHCINEAAFRALENGDAAEFVTQRNVYIEQEEGRFYSQFGVSVMTQAGGEAEEDAES